jgi:hypothetical protein
MRTIGKNVLVFLVYNKFSYVSFINFDIKLKIKIETINKIKNIKKIVSIFQYLFSSFHKFKEHTSYANINTLIGITLCFKKDQNVKCFLIFNRMK